jgi:hypothetical protein
MGAGPTGFIMSSVITGTCGIVADRPTLPVRTTTATGWEPPGSTS